MLILEVLSEIKSKQGGIAAAFHYANLEGGANVFVEMHFEA